MKLIEFTLNLYDRTMEYLIISSLISTIKSYFTVPNSADADKTLEKVKYNHILNSILHIAKHELSRLVFIVITVFFFGL